MVSLSDPPNAAFEVATEISENPPIDPDEVKEFAQSLDIVEDTANFAVIDDSNTLKHAKKMVKQVKDSGGVVWVDLTSDKPNVNQSPTKEEFESDAGGDDAVDKGEVFIVYKNL